MSATRAEERFVIARRWTGLGDCIVSLAAAWMFARATGRTLVADWRFSPYAVDGANVFDLVFEPTSDLGGVPFLSGHDFSTLGDLSPSWPPGWTAQRVADISEPGESGQTELAVARIRSGVDVDQRVVVFDGCLKDAAPVGAEMRAFLRALTPRAEVRDDVSAFVERYLTAAGSIAVHVRHGNGGQVMDHAQHWASPTRTLFDIIRVVLSARDRLAVACGESPAVLICTDSVEVRTAMRAGLADAVIWGTQLPEAGAGQLHLGPHASSGLHDAMVEMLLMAQTDVLVRFPRGTLFSEWAAALKPEPPIDVADLALEGLAVSIS